MDSNTPTPIAPQPEAQNSSKKTLVILVSILVLAGIVGIVLFLYIQNKQSLNTTTKPNQTTQNIQKSYAGTYDSLPLSELERPQPKSSMVTKSDCTNKTVFTSIDQALGSQDDVCILALDNQNLTTLPSSVLKLTKLKFIYLRGNKFDTIPDVLYKMQSLWGIDLSGNQISSISTDLNQIKNLEIIVLKDNKLSNESFKNLKSPLNFNLTVSL